MQDTVTKCLGLVTQYNSLSVLPGALAQADDCVIRRENTIENRRGYAVYGTVASAPAQLFVYSKKILTQSGTSISYDNGSGTFLSYSGSYSAPTGAKMRSVSANSNLYITTSSGVQVLTDVAGTAARKAGAPRSLDPSYALNAAATGFLAAGYQAAYRCVIQRTDANGNVLYGYPSTRLVVYNSAGTGKNVDFTLYLPSEVTTSDVVQVYRTTQVSGTASDLSGDEAALVYQVNPTSTDVTNGYLTFTDVIVDELRGATLYTSPSQEGIIGANDRPPLAKDIALYKSSYMFYANTQTKQRLNITLVGVSGLSGKTITLGGVTYSFGASEIVSGGGSPQALVTTTGAAASNIDATARSLVRVINRYAGNTTVYAYYLSGYADLPGQILIEERGVGASAFTVQASDTTISGMFFPAPPVGTTNSKSTSSNSVQKNALFFSKTQQPEAVPAANYILVGPANTEILRIVALRDCLLIIKEEGIYRLVGETSASFSVTPLDLTVYCKALDSVAVLSNQCYFLSNQGVVAATDAGVQVMSREIEPSLLPLLSYSNMSSYTYGTGYESERSYILSTVSSSADTAPTQTFVYNVFTRAWVRWSFGFTAAVVESTVDKMFLTKSSDVNVYRERKDFADSDYADPSYAASIVSITGSTVVLNGYTTNPQVGWALKQGTTTIGITAVSIGSTAVCTMAYPPPAAWTTGAVEVLPAVPMTVVYDAWSGGQSAILKHVRQVNILTDSLPGNMSATGLTATFKTDLDSDTSLIPITSQASRWGSSPWGSFKWGGAGDTFAYPTYVPRNKQYCRIMNAGVTHSRANEKISISGISYTFEMVGERTSK